MATETYDVPNDIYEVSKKYYFPSNKLLEIENLQNNRYVVVSVFPTVFVFKKAGDTMFIDYNSMGESIEMTIVFEDGYEVRIPPKSQNLDSILLLEEFTTPFAKWPWGRPISKIEVQVSTE